MRFNNNKSVFLAGHSIEWESGAEPCGFRRAQPEVRCAAAGCGLRGGSGVAVRRGRLLRCESDPVDLTAQSRSAAVTVRNSGDDPVVVQITVQAWSQSAG